MNNEKRPHEILKIDGRKSETFIPMALACLDWVSADNDTRILMTGAAWLDLCLMLLSD